MALNLTDLSHADLVRFCALPGLGRLTPDMVTMHGPDALLAWEEGDVVMARASLWWRQVPDHPGQRLGLIGHYAAADPVSAEKLLEVACTELSRQGCTLAVGPMDGNTWRRYRLLTERGNEPPFFLEPDNPDDWPGHFTRAGFHTFARYYSSINDDNSRYRDRQALLARLETRGYQIRALDGTDLDEELGRLWRLAETGFDGNFLYQPIEEGEFRSLYAPHIGQIRPEMVCINEWHGEPVAFCLAVPNLLQAQRGEAIDTLVVKSIAVAPAHRGRGLAAVMLSRVNRSARSLGMTRTIHALMHEDNSSRKLDAPLMRDFRQYALFARTL